MPKGRKGTAKKNSVVKTRQAGVKKIQRQDQQRVKDSKAVKGKGGRRGA